MQGFGNIWEANTKLVKKRTKILKSENETLKSVNETLKSENETLKSVNETTFWKAKTKRYFANWKRNKIPILDLWNAETKRLDTNLLLNCEKRKRNDILKSENEIEIKQNIWEIGYEWNVMLHQPWKNETDDGVFFVNGKFSCTKTGGGDSHLSIGRVAERLNNQLIITCHTLLLLCCFVDASVRARHDNGRKKVRVFFLYPLLFRLYQS